MPIETGHDQVLGRGDGRWRAEPFDREPGEAFDQGDRSGDAEREARPLDHGRIDAPLLPLPLRQQERDEEMTHARREHEEDQ